MTVVNRLRRRVLIFFLCFFFTSGATLGALDVSNVDAPTSVTLDRDRTAEVGADNIAAAAGAPSTTERGRGYTSCTTLVHNSRNKRSWRRVKRR